MQRSEGICILRQQGGEQAASVYFQLEQLVNIQGGGIAHHVSGKVTDQGVAAEFSQHRQGGGLYIEVGAPRVRVDGFEGVGDGLDLGHTPRRISQPCARDVLRQHLWPAGIVVRQFIEPGSQAFVNKSRNH